MKKRKGEKIKAVCVCVCVCVWCVGGGGGGGGEGIRKKAEGCCKPVPRVTVMQSSRGLQDEKLGRHRYYYYC